MSLKMIQGDKDIGIHNGLSDFGFFDVFAAVHRDERFVCPLQAVADDDVASR